MDPRADAGSDDVAAAVAALGWLVEEVDERAEAEAPPGNTATSSSGTTMLDRLLREPNFVAAN